jgi:tRNA dimethylallyltransferase
MSALSPLVVVLGPTASGKSALGISLAQKLGGEILVCDSTQVYRHFDIGTAKVSSAEQRAIPHHLIDLVEPDEVFTAGEYRQRAVKALEELRLRKKLPIVTAGTGLYLRALIEGLSEAPTRSEELRERLRMKARAKDPTYLHKILARIDVEAAARIAPRDAPKVIRAIEIRLLAQKPVGEVHRRGRSALEGYAVTKIGLLPPRAALYAAIEQRVEEMIRAGWIDELRRLMAMGISPGAKPFQFIGYADLREHIEGRLSLDTAMRQIRHATRRFAKRQLTWFRREPGVRWLAGFGTDPEIQAEALEIASHAIDARSEA